MNVLKDIKFRVVTKNVLTVPMANARASYIYTDWFLSKYGKKTKTDKCSKYVCKRVKAINDILTLWRF